MPRATSSSIDRLWANNLTRALIHEKKPSGEGWRTRQQLMKDLGVSKRQILRAINVLKAEGKVEQFFGTVHNGKRAENQVWYRLKTGDKLSGLGKKF